MQFTVEITLGTTWTLQGYKALGKLLMVHLPLVT